MNTTRKVLCRLCLFCAMLLSLHTTAETVQPATVSIELTGLDKASGNIYIAVYDSDDDWLGDDVILRQKVVIADALDGKVVHTAFDLPPGEYAFSIFYDVNDNGKLDTNFIGIPKEPVALSNNARPKFGPPKYKDAVFPVTSEPVIQRLSIEAI